MISTDETEPTLSEVIERAGSLAVAGTEVQAYAKLAREAAERELEASAYEAAGGARETPKTNYALEARIVAELNELGAKLKELRALAEMAGRLERRKEKRAAKKAAAKAKRRKVRRK